MPTVLATGPVVLIIEGRAGQSPPPAPFAREPGLSRGRGRDRRGRAGRGRHAPASPRLHGLPDLDDRGYPPAPGWATVPIIVLSARGGSRDKAALAAARDLKLFAVGELLARARVALRHSAQERGSRSVDVHVLRHRPGPASCTLTRCTRSFMPSIPAVAVLVDAELVDYGQLLQEVWGRAGRADALPPRLHGEPPAEARGGSRAPAAPPGRSPESATGCSPSDAGLQPRPPNVAARVLRTPYRTS